MLLISFQLDPSFFGDVHATGASSFNDISANDISCVDISASTITLIGNKLYANNVEFTFPTTGGELGAQGQGAGAFPGIGTTSGKCYDGALGNDISNNVAANATAISGKQATIDTNNRLDATLIGANGNVSNSEYGYLSDVTSSIQSQLNGKTSNYRY